MWDGWRSTHQHEHTEHKSVAHSSNFSSACLRWLVRFAPVREWPTNKFYRLSIFIMCSEMCWFQAHRVGNNCTHTHTNTQFLYSTVRPAAIHRVPTRRRMSCVPSVFFLDRNDQPLADCFGSYINVSYKQCERILIGQNVQIFQPLAFCERKALLKHAVYVLCSCDIHEHKMLI